ncbi:unnamed protein product [Penicillium olsonii]|nr:unnamed protein product [Penicillium olsonii]
MRKEGALEAQTGAVITNFRASASFTFICSPHNPSLLLFTLHISPGAPRRLNSTLSRSLTLPAMRDSSLKRSVGVDLTRSIKESRVLLVGAGGIGCELLKNLVLTGFGEIHIIDLDTIDLSNLNRQFLFRHEHIKKSKALVAKEVAQKFRPDAKLEAYHANIMDPQFNISWFGSFSVVFNALDNLAARRYVNKMCLRANVPLIESGTMGFNGQVQVIKKSETECYDCNAKETPKSFPVCTIRSTPSQSIHCIVWAKSFLLPDDETDNWPANEIEELRKEALEFKALRESIGTEEGPQKVFDKVFKADIERLRSMEDMWKTRKAPELLDSVQLQEQSASIDSTISKKDQSVWSLAENFAVFKDSFNRLSQRLKALQANTTSDQPSPILTFDKDDEDTLDFVAATANLRAAIFHIELNSKFEIKRMAGNIIPAIATTNAMTAGLCVLQSFKVFQNDLPHTKTVFLERSGARAINSESLNPPNPNCATCSFVQARVEIDPESATFGHLVEILENELGYKKGVSISFGDTLIIEPELDPEDSDSSLEDNLGKKLSRFEIANESILTVKDENDEETRVTLEVLILQKTEPSSADSCPAKLLEVVEIPLEHKQPVQPSSSMAEDSLDLATVDGTSVIGKRKREGEDDGGARSPGGSDEHSAKRPASKPAIDTDTSEPIVLDDDDEEGIITLDD